jgi:DNA-binding LytR/AlgR family response regulator
MAKKHITQGDEQNTSCTENNTRLYNGFPAGELWNCLLQLCDSGCKLGKMENSDFHIWNDGKLIRIETDKIAYLEAARCYCEINMADGKKFVPSLPLSEVAAYLPQSRFVRVHRSFVVNRKMLNEINGNIIILPDKKQLPIGREYRKALMNSLTIINTKNKKYFP